MVHGGTAMETMEYLKYLSCVKMWLNSRLINEPNTELKKEIDKDYKLLTYEQKKAIDKITNGFESLIKKSNQEFFNHS